MPAFTEKKTDHPFGKPYLIRLMSCERWISLVIVLSIHLLFVGWIGWRSDSSAPEIAAPITGILLAGDNGSGGNGGNSGGQAGKKAGSREALLKKTSLIPGKKRTEISERPVTKKAAKISNNRPERVLTAKPAIADRETSSFVLSPKTDDTAGSTGVFGGKSDTNSGGNSFGGVSSYGDGHGNGGDGNGSGYGGTGKGNGSGGFSGPYGKTGSSGNPKPPYPAVSRRMGEEGIVVLSVMIEADGTVSDVKLKRSSGFPRLDASALNTVRHWRYIPAKKNGFPVAFRYIQPIRFSLDD